MRLPVLQTYCYKINYDNAKWYSKNPKYQSEYDKKRWSEKKEIGI